LLIAAFGNDGYVSGFFRTLLGVPCVLFFPGYTLVALLFPGKADLGGFERMALSFGLSIVVLPLLGLALNFTPFGIRPLPLLMSLFAFIALTSFMGSLRRARLQPEERSIPDFQLNWPPPGDLPGQYKPLGTVLLLVLLFTMGYFVYAVATPKAEEPYTEFYILGEKGQAEEYPRELTTGEVKEVLVGIVNHEHREVDYNVQIKVGSVVSWPTGTIKLGHGEKWEKPVIVWAYKPDEKLRVEFLLFKEGELTPCRSLYLWLRVVP